MNVSENFVDFVRSSDTSTTIETTKYSSKVKAVISKKPLKNENFQAIYLAYLPSDSEPFDDITYKYLATVDTKTLEILHASTEAYYNSNVKFFEGSYDDIRKKTDTGYMIRKEIDKKVKEMLETMQEELLSKVNFSQFKEQIMSEYKNPGTYEEPTAFSSSLKINFDVLSDYYSNPEEYVKQMAKEFCTEDVIKKYTEYIAIQKGYRDYIESLTHDDYAKIKDDILKIMQNNKYKNVKINFKYPDGYEDTKTYSKDEYGHHNVKNHVMDKNMIQNIPINAITSIQWGRSTLYKRTEEIDKKINYTEEQQIEDFIKLKYLYHMPSRIYADKEYLDLLFEEHGKGVLPLMDKKLFNDFNFMKDFVERHEKQIPNFLSYLKGSEILKDKKFLFYLIDKYKENSRYFTSSSLKRIFDIAPPIMFTDKEFLLKVLPMAAIDEIDYLKKIDKYMLNDPDIINIFKTQHINLNSNYKEAFALFNTPETLLSVFDKKTLQENLSQIDEYILSNDKALLMTLLDDMSPSHSRALFNNESNYYLTAYLEDKEVINRIAKIISGQYSLKKFAALLCLSSEVDQERIFEFASENIEFLELLKPEDVKTYFEGEVLEINKINSFKNRTIELQSAFGVFVVEPRYSSTISITFEDFNGHEYRIRENKEELEQEMLTFLKNTIKFDTSKTLYEYFGNNGDDIRSFLEKNYEEER